MKVQSPVRPHPSEASSRAGLDERVQSTASKTIYNSNICSLETSRNSFVIELYVPVCAVCVQISHCVIKN